jgi:hypothetical protein
MPTRNNAITPTTDSNMDQLYKLATIAKAFRFRDSVIVYEKGFRRGTRAPAAVLMIGVPLGVSRASIKTAASEVDPHGAVARNPSWRDKVA